VSLAAAGVGPTCCNRCIGGERECNFGSPLSSDAKCIVVCISLLQMIVALEEAKMDLHLLVGLSLKVVWALL
jgi:hypothetical protein